MFGSNEVFFGCFIGFVRHARFFSKVSPWSWLIGCQRFAVFITSEQPQQRRAPSCKAAPPHSARGGVLEPRPAVVCGPHLALGRSGSPLPAAELAVVGKITDRWKWCLPVGAMSAKVGRDRFHPVRGSLSGTARKRGGQGKEENGDRVEPVPTCRWFAFRACFCALTLRRRRHQPCR